MSTNPPVDFFATERNDIRTWAREDAEKIGVDPGLAERMFGQESGFNNEARSPKGAFGVAQLMPGTADYVSKKYGVDTTTPRGNLQGGLYYLKEQLDEFGHDRPDLAVAAYHAGPGAVRKAGNCVPDTNDGLISTRAHVRKVVGGYQSKSTSGSGDAGQRSPAAGIDFFRAQPGDEYLYRQPPRSSQPLAEPAKPPAGPAPPVQSTQPAPAPDAQPPVSIAPTAATQPAPTAAAPGAPAAAPAQSDLSFDQLRQAVPPSRIASFNSPAQPSITPLQRPTSMYLPGREPLPEKPAQRFDANGVNAGEGRLMAPPPAGTSQPITAAAPPLRPTTMADIEARGRAENRHWRAQDQKRLGAEEDAKHSGVVNFFRHAGANLTAGLGETGATLATKAAELTPIGQLVEALRPQTHEEVASFLQEIQRGAADLTARNRGESFTNQLLYQAGRMAPKMAVPGHTIGFGAAEALDALGHGAPPQEALMQGLEAAATARLAGAFGEAAAKLRPEANVAERFATQTLANAAAPAAVHLFTTQELPDARGAAFDLAFGALFALYGAKVQGLDPYRPIKEFEPVMGELTNHLVDRGMDRAAAETAVKNAYADNVIRAQREGVKPRELRKQINERAGEYWRNKLDWLKQYKKDAPEQLGTTPAAETEGQIADLVRQAKAAGQEVAPEQVADFFGIPIERAEAIGGSEPLREPAAPAVDFFSPDATDVRAAEPPSPPEGVRENVEPPAPVSEPSQERGRPAVWRNQDADQPVTVTGEAGLGSDGRDYVNIAESKAAIPKDEIDVAPVQTPVPGAPAAVDTAAHEAATSPLNELPEPTEGQIEAGNYQKGHVRVAGLDVSIENPQGSKRRPEWPALKSHYGYIRRTEGGDGEHLDVFVRPGTPADYDGPVYVVDQTNEKGEFDEHKVMFGWPSEAEARKGYAENYTKGWKVGPIRKFKSPAEFRQWLKTADTSQPAAVIAPSRYNDPSGKYHGIVKEVTRITPDELRPLNQQELNGALYNQKSSGKSPEEWAKSVDLTEPIDATIYSDGEIKIQDGHHRYLAAKTLGVPLNVKLQAINTKNEILNAAVERIRGKVAASSASEPSAQAAAEANRARGLSTDGRMPHEMPLSEYRQEWYERSGEEPPSDLDRVNAREAADERLITEGHRYRVENALKRGAAVLPEVLADYPDLAASPAGRAQTAAPVKAAKKPPHEMSPAEFDDALKNQPNTISPHSQVIDWGTRRGQGRRAGGAVKGAMSDASIQGKKTYVNEFRSLPDYAEIRTEVNELNPIEGDAYLRARSFGLGHEAAMRYAYEASDAKAVGAAHRFVIEGALAAGERVPPEVLRDYPGLVSHHSQLQPRNEGGQFDGPPVDLPQSETPTPAGIADAGSLARSLADRFGYAADHADATAAIADARADAWSKQSGRDKAEWYKTRLAGIERGGEMSPDALRQQDRLRQQAEAFGRAVDKAVAGKINRGDPIKMSDTPEVLQKVGAPPRALVITGATIEKITADKHALGLDEVKQLPLAIADPVMVFRSDSQPDSLVVLTELKDGQGKPVVTAVHLNSQVGRYVVNRVASAYGKDDIYGVERWLKKGLLLYANKSKSLA